MSEQIVTTLKRKLDDLAPYGELDPETRRNALKEELQFYVLNFIYHHPECSEWIMYGGSALRIVHGLDRMSEDLDFEIAPVVTEDVLDKLKSEIEAHFAHSYDVDSGFLTTKITTSRGLLLKFHVGRELSFGLTSDQVRVKIDLNHFVLPKTVRERRPINHDQLSFVIVCYNMAALMASKIAAISLRETRGVGKAVYQEKGRDIYDLLWYMNKKVVPDFDYLVAKGVDIKDPRALFDKLTLQMNKVSDENLKQDLLHLFTNRPYIENWLKNWRESYWRLLDDYKIRTVVSLENIVIHKDFDTDNFSFIYYYRTEESGSIRVMYTVSDYWIKNREGNLPIQIDGGLKKKKIDFSGVGWSSWTDLPDKIKQYVTLFYQKTESYFKKNNKIMLGDSITTKVIRMTADRLNLKEQIVLRKSALLSCELDDLLK